MKRASVILATLFLCSCFTASINVVRHPDYNFSPTNPDNIVAYDGFLPNRDFIIIARITITQDYLTNLKKSAKEIANAVASIGGNGIIFSGSQVQWMKYNQAVKNGSANITDYGFGYRANWRETTTSTQQDVAVSRDIYGYIIRWTDFAAKSYIDPAKYYIPGKRVRAKIRAVFGGKQEDKIIVEPDMKLLGKIPETLTLLPGMYIDISYHNDNNIRLFIAKDGFSYEASFRKAK